jgi:arylsulfatase A-like enzyme
LLPLLRGEKVKRRAEAFFELDAERPVRTDRWKYIALRPVQGTWRTFEKQVQDCGGHRDLLFDLKHDPQEALQTLGGHRLCREVYFFSKQRSRLSVQER